jgi:hypothetical protein
MIGQDARACVHCARKSAPAAHARSYLRHTESLLQGTVGLEVGSEGSDGHISGNECARDCVYNTSEPMFAINESLSAPRARA